MRGRRNWLRSQQDKHRGDAELFGDGMEQSLTAAQQAERKDCGQQMGGDHCRVGLSGDDLRRSGR